MESGVKKSELIIGRVNIFAENPKIAESFLQHVINRLQFKEDRNIQINIKIGKHL